LWAERAAGRQPSLAFGAGLPSAARPLDTHKKHLSLTLPAPRSNVVILRTALLPIGAFQD